jgi:hypothetical protein
LAKAAPKPPPEKVSPFPHAYVARLADPAGEKVSATLIARQVGYLAVRVTFHKKPCVGLEVKFSKAGDDGKPGAQVGEKVKTNKRGIARFDYLVTAGVYVCEIQNQHPTLVTTVVDLAHPYAVVTPIDRPFFDVEEAHEWDEEQLDVDAGHDGEEPDEEAGASGSANA